MLKTKHRWTSLNYASNRNAVERAIRPVILGRKKTFLLAANAAEKQQLSL